MTAPLAVTARPPGTSPDGQAATAASAAELARVVREQGATDRPVQLVGDQWLRWADRDRLGAALAAAGCTGPVEIVTAGAVYAAPPAAAIAHAAGVSRATVRLPAHAIGAQADFAVVERCLAGAVALAGTGVAVGLAVPVNRFTRGWLDELALAAARAGAIGFWPMVGRESTGLARFAELARARFASVRAARLPAEPRAVSLTRVRPLPGFDPAACPWRQSGWPGDPPGPRAAILCLPGAEPELWALPAAAPVSEERLVWLKHALEQVALAGAPRPLRPAAPCTECLRRLECPAAWIPAAAPGPADEWPPAPAGPRVTLDLGRLDRLHERLDALGPGAALVVAGRAGRLVLGAEGAPAPPDPSVADPQLVADLARVRGLETASYGLPWGTADDGWWVEVRRPTTDPGPGLRPRQAVLMVTNVCVTRCLMCGFPNLFARAHSPLHHVLRHLAELRLLGTARVDLFGGEVTLRHDVLGVAEFARRRGLRTSFITTGYGLEPRFVAGLEGSAVDQVEVALDGAAAETHDRVKGGLEVFADATRLVRTLVADGRRVVGVNTVILKENMAELPATVALAAELGVDEARLFSCIRFALHRGLQEPFSVEDAARVWDEIVPAARQAAADRGLPLEVCGACRLDAEPRATALAAFVDGRPNALPRLGRRCVAPRTDLTIGIDGTLVPCLNPSFYVDVVRRPGGALTRPVWEVQASGDAAALAAQAGLLPSCERCICFREEHPAGRG